MFTWTLDSCMELDKTVWLVTFVDRFFNSWYICPRSHFRGLHNTFSARKREHVFLEGEHLSNASAPFTSMMLK